MTDAFRITVHWGQGILEVRYPTAPTAASFARYSQEIRAVVGKLGPGWKCLVDHSSLADLPAELAPRIRELNRWAISHGMGMSARVMRPGASGERQVADLFDTAGTAVPTAVYPSREAAWTALTEREGASP